MMNRRSIATTLIIVTGAATLASCAATPQQANGAASASRQCFRPAQVNGFHAVDSDTVRVDVGANNVYELQLFGSCPSIDFSSRIGVRSTRGSSWVCQGYEAELLIPAPSGTERCAVTSVRKLSPPEVEALRAARRG